MTSYELNSATQGESQMRIIGHLLRYVSPLPTFQLLEHVVTGSPDMTKAQSGLEQSGGTIAAILMLLIFGILQFGCIMYVNSHFSFVWIPELLKISGKDGVGIYFDIAHDIVIGLFENAVIIFFAAWLLKKWADIGTHIRWLFFGLTCAAYLLSSIRWIVTGYLENKTFEMTTMWSNNPPTPGHIDFWATATLLLISSLFFWYIGVKRVEAVVGREKCDRGFWSYRFMVSASIALLFAIAEFTGLQSKATFQNNETAFFDQNQIVRPNTSAILIAMIDKCGPVKDKITCAVTLSPGYPQNFTLYGDWTSKVMAEDGAQSDQIATGATWRLRTKRDDVFPYVSLTPMRLENVEIEAPKSQACPMGQTVVASSKQIRVHFGVLGRVNALNPGVRSTIDLIVSDTLSMFEDIAKACQ